MLRNWLARLTTRQPGLGTSRTARTAMRIGASGAVLALPIAALGLASTVHAGAAAPNGSFITVDIPGNAVRKVRTEDTFLGEVRTVSMIGESGDAKVAIAVSKLPSLSDNLASERKMYGKAKRKLLRRYDAKSTAWKVCKRAGHECRYLEYAAEDGRKGIARLYLEGEMMVIVNGSYDDDKTVVERFHDSTRSK